MALRRKLFSTFESFLRVPPLILMDEILRYSFGLGAGGGGGKLGESEYENPNNNNASDIQQQQHESSETLSPATWFGSMLNYWVEIFTSISGSQISAVENIGETHNNEPAEYFLHIRLGEVDWTVIYQSLSQDFLKVADFLACVTLFSILLVVFLLSSKNLIRLYSYILSCIALYVAYFIPPIPDPKLWTKDLVPLITWNILVRTFLSCLYLFTCSYSNSSSGDNIESQQQERSSRPPRPLDCIIVPVFFLTCFVHIQPTIYVLLILVLENSIRINITKVFTFLKLSFDETKRIRNEFGISHVIQIEVGRLKLNTVFRLFWITKAFYDAFYQIHQQNQSSNNQPIGQLFKYVIVHGTETFTGIVGITVIISTFAHQCGELILWILYWGANTESETNRFGSISTVLFFILSLQTGLTSLEAEKRLDRLFKNSILLATALFHALHQMLGPILHAFRAFQGIQIRAVILSLTFLGVSIYSTMCLLQSSPISTWSLAVLALAIEFKVKIVISLIISIVVYLSQLIQYPQTFHRIGNGLNSISPQFLINFFSHRSYYDEISHEDAIFYLKSIANVAEFLTGIFLFANAVWIFMFESASAIRAIGMSIHAYFNIWCEAKKGWKIYCQRRTAAKKIMSLKDASETQLLEKRDDVCAICYEEMESAKVTYCQHLFHAVCLRKWLYLQNTCPLCHEILYSEESLERSQIVQGQGANAAAAGGGSATNPNDQLRHGVSVGGSRFRNGIRYYRRPQEHSTSSSSLRNGQLSVLRSETDSRTDYDDDDIDDEDEFSDTDDEVNQNQPANGGLVVFL